MIFELVEVVTHDVPSDEPRAGRAKRLDRADISGTIDDDGVAGIDEAAGEQIEPLLRAGKYQHVVRLTAEAPGNRLAQDRLPFGGAVPPHRRPVALEHLVERTSKRVGREAVDRGNARRQAK